MRRILLAFFVLFSVSASAAPSTITGTATRVRDGDTIEVDGPLFA